MKAIYEAQVVSEGGRNGTVQSSDGLLNLKVAMPKELGGAGGATNPEQLFAAGYAACFENAVLHIARMKKIAITQSKVVGKVSLSANAEGGFVLGAHLTVSLPELSKDVANTLVQEAHRICPYSNATRGNIEVKIDLA